MQIQDLEEVREDDIKTDRNITHLNLSCKDH